jgi:serine/threonine-protein kinase
MATVWAGLDTRLDRPVAVKVLDEASPGAMVPLQQPDQEARALARLAHPTIVAVHDMGTDGGVAFVVMELVEGEDLRRRLTRGPVEAAEAVAIAVQVCDALEAAHRAGVVHLDIKPENILLTPTGAVKVCDFGIARLQRASRPNVTGGPTVGTAEYMAPEQATGSDAGPRADLYALGCVVYRMLAGRPVFAGADEARVLWQHANEAPTPLSTVRPDLPAALTSLVAQLLAKDPADRPASAGEVRARLSRMSGLPALSVPALTSTDGTPTRVRAGAARATAPVVAKTRMFPAIEDDSHVAERPVLHLGPAGIVIVAVSAAMIAALAVTLAIAPWRPLGGSDGVAPPPGVGSPPTTTAGVPAGTVDAVRAAIAAQVLAGGLTQNVAGGLDRDLDAIERNLRQDNADRAAERIRDLRDRLDDLRRDDRVSELAYTEILARLDELAATLPDGDGDDD